MNQGLRQKRLAFASLQSFLAVDALLSRAGRARRMDPQIMNIYEHVQCPFDSTSPTGPFT